MDSHKIPIVESIRKEEVLELPNRAPENPLLSVLVQTYNHDGFIAECLEGLLNQQTGFPYEILLGEDDSNDQTRAICMHYAVKYPGKIRLFFHKRENNYKINGRPSGRFNLLYNLSQARGKYIAFCEGDDFWNNTQKLQLQVDYLEQHLQITGVSCYANRIWIREKESEAEQKKDLAFKEYSMEVIYKSGIPGFRFCTLMYRNLSEFSFHQDLLNKEVAGDIILSTLALSKGNIVKLPFIGAVYRVHDGGFYSGHKDHLANRMLHHYNYRFIAGYLDGFNARILFWFKYLIMTIKYDLMHFQFKLMWEGIVKVFNPKNK